MNFNPNDLFAILPEIILLVAALAIILLELTVTRNPAAHQSIAAAAMLAAGISAITVQAPSDVFGGVVAADGMSSFIKAVLAGVGLLTILLSGGYFAASAASGLRMGEFYALLLMTTIGMMTLAAATDLMMLFLGVETMSIGLYLLAGFRHEKPRSSESALKYLLLGAFASGFLLFGMALVYGASGGETGYPEITRGVSQAMSDISPLGIAAKPVLMAGMGLILVGLLFKAAAAPFHFWSPDVYQGAPTPVTAFMSAGPKAAAIIATLRLFGFAFQDVAQSWAPLLWGVAALTMTIGNIVALSQKDIKRMLAYSSISHAGYLLIGVLAAKDILVRPEASSALMFYLAAYYLMNLGAFTIAIAVSRGREGGDYELDDYQGLAAKHPYLALTMLVFMVSLAGIPPTAGFFGKLFVFSAAVQAGYVWLVVIAVLNSVVSAFYYLRPVVYMYMKPAGVAVEPKLQFGSKLTAAICVAGIIALGLVPSLIKGPVDRSVEVVQKL